MGIRQEALIRSITLALRGLEESFFQLCHCVVSVFGSGGKKGLSGGCAIIITTGEKKIQSSVWRVRDRYYDRKKKIQSSIWRVRDQKIMTRKKKIQSSGCAHT
jgi:hypothetical protein